MSRLEKEIERLKSEPKDYTYYEAKSILNSLGFIEYTKGKTSGSRIRFINGQNKKIDMHKPHDNILKAYQINEILRVLKEGGLL